MERSLFRPDDRADHPSDFHIQRLGDFQEGIKCRVGFPILKMPNPGTAQPGKFSQAVLGNPLPHTRLDQPGNHGVNNLLLWVMRHAENATAPPGAQWMALKGRFLLLEAKYFTWQPDPAPVHGRCGFTPNGKLHEL